MIPPLFFYLRISVNPNYTGPILDPYLFIRGVAISALTMPLFIGLGLLLAAFIQVALRYFRRRSAHFTEGSWVTRRGHRGRQTQ
ncbi:MAG: hypothetical protein IIB14_04865 [Chloroflexi bacterium]|nr:hypothetical protein [Chloroflexota bacterium]